MKRTLRLTQERLLELGTDELEAIAGAQNLYTGTGCTTTHFTIQIKGTRECETLPLNQCVLSVLC